MVVTSESDIEVRGEGLIALAASLRLARLGHRVTLVAADPAWRSRARRPLSGELPPVLEVPAAWRDLFGKSGRNMDAELARDGFALTEAPPVLHRMEKETLALPTERAAQIAAVRTHWSPDVARIWSHLLDRADEAWQARRALGLEYPVAGALRGGDLPRALAGRHLTDGCDDLPALLRAVVGHLGPVAGGTRAGRGGTPLLADLAVPRVFGRWQLTRLDDGSATTLQPLLDALDRRLGARGVEVAAGPPRRPDLVIDTEPPRRRFGHDRPFLAPTVRLTRSPDTAPGGRRAERGVEHSVDHTPAGPVLHWSWSEQGQRATLTHDHTRPVRRPDLGRAIDSTAAWRRRPPLQWIRDDGAPVLAASPAAHGGPEPWAQLLTGALAAYLSHERLTGQDVSPHNRAVGADGRLRRH